MDKRRTKLDRKYTQQIIISKPDGAFAQGIPTDYVSEASSMRDTVNEVEMVALLDDQTVDEVVDIYIKHRNTFLTLLTVQLIVELVFTVLEVYFYKSAIQDVRPMQVDGVYGFVGKDNVKFVFWGMFLGFLVLSCIYYPLGYISLATKRLNWLQAFSYCAVVGVIAQMVSAYMHKFNLLIFFFRLIMYVYSRFLISLMIGILLLPRSVV
jgi:hypothetical protein